MKIVVDADACPVKDIIESVAKKYSLEVIMVIDTSHVLCSYYSKVITVDKGRDSADIVVINMTSPSDIVVTQDFGVAAMAIGKGAHAISQNGMLYTNQNMDKLLFERYLSKKERKNRNRTGHIRKRTIEDDSKFKENFEKLCNRLTP